MDIFITGTDTDVGKTVITAGIAAVMQGLGYAMSVYKPVQSGCILQNGVLSIPDLDFVKSIDPNIKTKSTYNLINPQSPALAASMENVIINKSHFVHDFHELKSQSDFVIVEGAGGLMVPVYQSFLIKDLVKLLNLPLLIVANPFLGTVNHTLLTISAAKNAGIEVLGVIISNYPINTADSGIKAAPGMIKELGGVDILGILPEITGLGNVYDKSESLIDAVINFIDVQKIFNIHIPKLS